MKDDKMKIEKRLQNMKKFYLKVENLITTNLFLA